MEIFPEQLKNLRKTKGWSQEDLARNLGVSLNTVQRWEMGKNKPSRLAVEKIKELANKITEQKQLKLFDFQTDKF
jgi:transcriptional regulator with XRE-family HTH domain